MTYLHNAIPSNQNMAIMNAAVSQINKEGAAMDNTDLTARQQDIINEVERLVASGHQKEITTFFNSWASIPSKMGEWQFRVNFRRVDNAIVGRTVVALPLSFRTRTIFEKGCKATLIEKGFTKEDADRYYKFAWKKQYVWVDTVVSAVSEMIAAFRTTDVPQSYLETGDPRRLADSVKVPKNPFLVSHTHFMVAAEMAILVIDARNRDERDNIKVEGRQASSINDQATA